jgi:ABC-2 type transport system ATP-binding protein
MEAAVEVKGLRKRFGPTIALDQMTFATPALACPGFAGSNGAGKSTTMRDLGLDAAGAGWALIDGMPYTKQRHPLNHVGVIAGRGHAAAQPGRPQPLAAGPLTHRKA